MRDPQNLDPPKRETAAGSSDRAPEILEGDTKERLIDAGIEIFAQRGFGDTSVRQICAQAQANAAALSYHFGGKAAFYAEVLATCHERAVARRPIPRLDDDPENPQEVLRLWIRWFLELLLVDGDGPLGRLMAREMADPTPALDELVRRSMFPIMAVLDEILRVVFADAPSTTRQLCTNSLMGQCLFYRHAQPAMASLERLYDRGELLPDNPPHIFQLPDGAASAETLDLLADHIAQFSLAGFLAIEDRTEERKT